eukprot:Anaeramoba_ignava/c18566_g1_i2.p2 GENE.c18566_g1_i2~~c18566_g1_i2.p2  ORF type:complete len:102 (+),score=33.60 c18566_g1_i2:716-1021(+)
MKSLKCLKIRGTMVMYGSTSGPVDPISPLELINSIYLIRPSLFNYLITREEFCQRANDILGWISKGELKIEIGEIRSLEEVVQFHKDYESRKTTGKLLLKL